MTINELENVIKGIKTKEEFDEFSKKFELHHDSAVLLFGEENDQMFLESALEDGDAVEGSLVQAWVPNAYRDNCYWDLLWLAQIHGFSWKE